MVKKIYIIHSKEVPYSNIAKVSNKFKEYNADLSWWSPGENYDVSMLQEADMIILMLGPTGFRWEMYLSNIPSGSIKELAWAITNNIPVYIPYLSAGGNLNIYGSMLCPDLKIAGNPTTKDAIFSLLKIEAKRSFSPITSKDYSIDDLSCIKQSKDEEFFY